MKGQKLWLESDIHGSLHLHWRCSADCCGKEIELPIRDDNEALFLLCNCGNKLMLNDEDIHLLIAAYRLGSDYLFDSTNFSSGCR
ncbi:hypothetical protein [Neptuniibacter caesariensis]|uniref:Uncharacterized protein n=1 Tax=Neptuniibacter caesariensis TaxID=207954 RepID=A0A7U8C898_NEPCE|nr:hypothetical protein [Neptuniibacter caesariensis]EAR61641.1 hypothetical protein MED92_13341 [Oceanospirillum sp. MED92] [Neptuniibacter caesariensis]